MKTKQVLAILAAIIFYGTSCSNDFEIADTWKDIPVVYALLNGQDSVQYIRVEKAFLDADKNAFDMARNPDSLYYENLTVFLENTNNPDEKYFLEQVDGNVEDIPKDDGVFATTPNYLYKLSLGANGQLSGDATYRLTLERGDNKPPVTAETAIIDEIELKVPSSTSDLKIDLESSRNVRIRWETDPNAAFYEVKININYLEFYPDSTVSRTISWTPPDESEAEIDELEFPPVEFYKFMGNNIEVNPEITRLFSDIDIIISAGGDELFQYLEIGRVNTGLTSSQFLPTYSNLSEGYGILSSTYVGTYPRNLTFQTLNYIKTSEWTAALNFQ